MRINRYSRVTPSQFNPLSMKEIFTVPLARQRQHDENIALADELGLFDLNRLQADDETAREYIDTYGSNIDKVVDDIYGRGVTNEASRNLRKLAKDKQKWLSQDGVGGQIQANFNAYQNYKAGLDEALKDGKVLKDQYDALLNQATLNYKGVVNNGKLNLQTAANYVDVAKKLQPYMKDIMSNPDKIETNTGYKYDPNSGMFINIHSGHKTTQKGLIGIVANNLAKLDPEIMNHLEQMEALGFDKAEKVISDLSNTFDSSYSVNQHTQDITGKYPPEWMGGNNNVDNENDSFELEGAQELVVRNGELSTLLGNILENKKTMATWGPSEKGDFSNNYGISFNKGGEDYTLEGYEEDYNIILEGLIQSGVIDTGSTDLSNLSMEEINNDPDLKAQYIDNKKSQMLAVKKYLDEHQNLDFQNILNTENMYNTYTDRGIKKTTPTDLAQSIKNNGAYRIWIDKETGEEVQYEDLDQEQIQKGTVAGVYDSKNFLSEQFGSTIKSEALVSPYEYVTPDGKRYVVSRSQSELQTKEYRADVQYNNVWQKVTKYPDIPHKFNIPQLGGDINITKLSDGRIKVTTLDKETNEMTQNSKTYTLLNDDALREFFKNINK